MFRKKILITLFSLISMFAFSQVCPKGFTWDIDKGTCVKIMENPNDLTVQHFKCPNGYSWVTFKNDCLTNKRVNEIYDSLSVLYLEDPTMKIGSMPKSPQINIKQTVLASTPVEVDEIPEKVGLGQSILNRFKKPKEETEEVEIIDSTTDVINKKSGESNVIENSSDQLRQIDLWIRQGEQNAIEVVMLRNQVDSLKQEFEVLRSWTQNRDNSSIGFLASPGDSQETKSVKEELVAQRGQIANLKAEIEELKKRPAGTGPNTKYTFQVGKQNDLISKKEIYGQENLTFEIHCPTGFKWVNDESICLSNDKYFERSQIKAQNPNAQIIYGVRDVKCPTSFRWNSATNQCIPTLHAVKETN